MRKSTKDTICFSNCGHDRSLVKIRSSLIIFFFFCFGIKTLKSENWINWGFRKKQREGERNPNKRRQIERETRGVRERREQRVSQPPRVWVFGKRGFCSSKSGDSNSTTAPHLHSMIKLPACHVGDLIASFLLGSVATFRSPNGFLSSCFVTSSFSSPPRPDSIGGCDHPRVTSFGSSS